MRVKAIKNRTIRLISRRNATSSDLAAELRAWDEAPPVGREFGSPDFERLMEEDRRNQIDQVDPEQRGNLLES